MSDVFVSWVASLADIKASSVSSHMIKVTGDTAYYLMGVPRDPKIEVTTESKPDSLGRERGWAAAVDITVPSIQAGLTEIQHLDSLITGTYLPVYLRLGFAGDSNFIATSLLGLGWKLNCGERDFRTIDYMYKGVVKLSEMDGLFTNSAPAVGSPVSTDQLYALGQTVIVTDQVPGGLTKVEFKASGDAAYVSSDFINGSYTFETDGETGGGGRMIPRIGSIKFTFDAELLETSLTKIQLMQEMIQNDCDLKLTHMDGVVLTMSNTRIGLNPSFDAGGNVNSLRKIKLHATGSITDFTSWDALWA